MFLRNLIYHKFQYCSTRFKLIPFDYEEIMTKHLVKNFLVDCKYIHNYVENFHSRKFSFILVLLLILVFHLQMEDLKLYTMGPFQFALMKVSNLDLTQPCSERVT